MNVMNILFIDDDDAFRQVTSDVLDHLGYEVIAVSNLAGATIALRNAQFDLILSDLCISGDRDGLLILDFLDSMDIEVPVIFITGSGYWERPIPADDLARSVGFLRKPVTMSELKRAIESVRPHQASEQHIAYKGQLSPSGPSSRRATSELIHKAVGSS